MVDQPADEKIPSWVGKKVEDMTASEKKEYEASLERFVWKEGDVKVIRNEPLTDDEKKLVAALRKDRETQK